MNPFVGKGIPMDYEATSGTFAGVERGALENRHKISTPISDPDERQAFIAAGILTWVGLFLSVLSPFVGFIIMVTSDDGTPGPPPMLFVGLNIFVVGTLSGLFMVMTSSFVRAHLNSQTQLINLMRSQSNPELSPPT
jgi:hypothetical protein